MQRGRKWYHHYHQACHKTILPVYLLSLWFYIKGSVFYMAHSI